MILQSSMDIAMTGEKITATARPKGPSVWMDLDQQALDDAYDQEVYAPNRAQIVERRHANSDILRDLLGQPSRYAYGPSEIEKLDVFKEAEFCSMCGPKFCSYKISQDIMENPEAIAKIAADAKAAG